MEPRVSNLLLAEQAPADRHEGDLHGVVGNPTSAAVFPSTTLPAIRPLHEAQLIDTRPYTNEIDSLTLPEIDWHALTASLGQQPQASGTSAVVQASADQPVTKKNRTPKSGAPIAEVLNQVSPDIRNAQRNRELAEPEARKRRRLEAAPVARTLPRPSPAAKKNGKRHLLPPLLVPLHEPPPDAGLIPSMETEGFKARTDKALAREPQQDKQQPSKPASKVRMTEKERAGRTDEPRTSHASKNRRTRQNWSKEETSDLLRGVAKFGIGNWKKILDCPEYSFRNRTAVDLKDRFRTCCPDEYKKVGSQKPQTESTSDSGVKGKQISKPLKAVKPPETEKSNKFENKLPDELARLGISGPFPKAQRRARRGFTIEEDEAILRGFEKYGAKWTKIQSDPDLGLSSRSRTDLRDRFRNKYPEKFIETGHKFDKKDGKTTKDIIEPDRDGTAELVFSSSARESALAQAPPAMIVQDTTSSNQHFQRNLTTASIAEANFFPDFGDLAPDTDVPGTITLSRNIFDWADQNNTRTTAAPPTARGDTTVVNVFDTITTMDQFHINPMLALKVGPSTTGGVAHKDATIAAAPSNLFPQLPLSGILNGPVSLPSAAELVSGMEDEGGNS